MTTTTILGGLEGIEEGEDDVVEDTISTTTIYSVTEAVMVST